MRLQVVLEPMILHTGHTASTGEQHNSSIFKDPAKILIPSRENTASTSFTRSNFAGNLEVSWVYPMSQGGPATVNLKLLIFEIAGMFVVFGLALFLAAGTVVWLSGWVFLVLFFGFTIALTGWLLRHNPSLLKERMTGIGKPNQPAWDKVFFVVAQVFFLAWLVLMPLDAVRFRWSQVPGWLQVIGAVLLVCSFYIFFLTYRENPYVSPAVRIQTERGQTVISTGPYRYVRHPLYAAVIPFVVGTTFLLGSWYGLLGLVIVVGIAYRAVREERVLLAELPGYEEYMGRVKYRLIPYVW